VETDKEVFRRFAEEDDKMVEELTKEGVEVFTAQIQRRFYVGYNRASIIRDRVNGNLKSEQGE